MVNARAKRNACFSTCERRRRRRPRRVAPAGPYEKFSFATNRTRSDTLAHAMRRSPIAMFLLLSCLSSALSLASCVTYAEELNRGQRYFQANEYERALAIWRVLEQNVDSLSSVDRTRYAYLRGMTDY